MDGRSDIYSFAVVTYEMLTGRQPFHADTPIRMMLKHTQEEPPTLSQHKSGLPEGLNDVLKRALAKAPGDRYETAAALGEAFVNAVAGRGDVEDTVSIIKPATAPLFPGTPATQEKRPTAQAEPRNPFKGLRAFKAEDRRDFFGREALVNELLMALEKADKPPRFLAVVGASGSGKSSVVMAGLLPALREGALPGSERWIYLDTVMPGSSPIENLTLSLARIIKDREITTITRDLKSSEGRGLYLLTRLLASGDERIVLYIDQFEELFTLTDEEERRQFIHLLISAVDAPDSPLIVIASLRADFYDRPMQYPALGKLFEQYSKSVMSMTAEELTEVVKRPAQLPEVNLIFEDGLVSDMVFAVRDQPSSLPLLQFALDQLFSKRDGHRLTQDAYEAIGGVQGALAKHAEATYQRLPTDNHRRLARGMFLRLTESGSTETESTRRRVMMSELTVADAADARVLSEVVETFLKARLLVSQQDGGQGTVEISHEALIRAWERLRDWVGEARDDQRIQRAFSSQVAEWLRRGKPVDRLYRGTALVDTLAWAGRNMVSKDETEFIHTSVATEKATKEQQEKTARRAQNFVRAAVIFSVVFALALIASGFALFQTSLAQQEAALVNENATQVARNAVFLGWPQTLAPGNIIITPNFDQPFEPFAATMTAVSGLMEREPVIQEFDGVAMVEVPAGCFYMGSYRDPNAQPVVYQCIEEPFWIDQLEVSNEQWETFDGEAESPPGFSEPNQPRDTVNWYEARNFCENRRPGNLRLPTELEWEYAARGPFSLTYTWGNLPQAQVAAIGQPQTQPVDSFEEGASWVGALNMIGNAWEWVNSGVAQDNEGTQGDFIYLYPYDATDGREAHDLGDDIRRGLRGGAWWDGGSPFIIASTRSNEVPTKSDISYGFRCAASEP